MFYKRYLFILYSFDFTQISDRVLSKSIGDTKEDRIMLRKLAALLDRTELEMQSHQAIWRKAAKPKRKIRMSSYPLFLSSPLTLLYFFFFLTHFL